MIIDEAIRSAAGRGATHVRVELKRHDGHLSVHMTDDGVTSTGMFTHLADRAGAAGGRLVDVTDGAGLTLRLEVPCV